MKLRALVANQITAAAIATTMALQTTGETFFELPLRGESSGVVSSQSIGGPTNNGAT